MSANSQNEKNLLYKIFFQPLLYLQILIFSITTIVSGYQTLYGIVNYESYMSNYSYLYNISKILNNYADEPILNMGIRLPLLFLKKEYIHEDRFNKCLNNKEIDSSILLDCAKNLKSNSLVLKSYKSETFDHLKCSSYPIIRTGRNPLKFKKAKKKYINICNIPNTDY